VLTDLRSAPGQPESGPTGLVLTSRSRAARFADGPCLLTDPPHADPQSPVPPVRPSTAPVCVVDAPGERLEVTHAAPASFVTSTQRPRFVRDPAGAEITRTLRTVTAGAPLTLPGPDPRGR
jgi:hypothetical protein